MSWSSTIEGGNNERYYQERNIQCRDTNWVFGGSRNLVKSTMKGIESMTAIIAMAAIGVTIILAIWGFTWRLGSRLARIETKLEEKNYHCTQRQEACQERHDTQKHESNRRLNKLEGKVFNGSSVL